MKIAIVCDWLITYAGAEKVLADILHCFPQADLFAVVDFLSPENRVFLQHKHAQTTFIQRLPFAKRFYRHYLPLMPLAIEQLNLSGYELVISSSHAVAKGIITGPQQTHICYIHSPMRYAWDLQHQYLQDANLDRGFKGFLAKLILHRMRIWDQRTANTVDHFIANSNFIAERVQKIYRRQAQVIYPAIDLTTFKPDYPKEDFYLTASRMVPYKKIRLIAESFIDLPDKKLIVIGDGPEFAKIKALECANIQVLGYIPTPQLAEYLSKAKAFIFAAEEDFGLLPLEAQASGTPVIAYQKGGAMETVRGLTDPHPTGVFFNDQSIAALQSAIQVFEDNAEKITQDNCLRNAANFSQERFYQAFQHSVQKICQATNPTS